jgi:hypothetical protein
MEGQDTITFSLPKGSKLIERLDSIRGDIRRSKAIRIILECILSQPDDYVRNVIGVKSLIKNSNNETDHVQQAQDQVQ